MGICISNTNNNDIVPIITQNLELQHTDETNTKSLNILMFSIDFTNILF